MSKQLKQSIYTYISNEGFPHNACIGIMGNIHVETGGTFDYTTKQKGGNGYGLFQFDYHKKYYNEYCKEEDIQDSAAAQVSYMGATIFGSKKNVIGAGNASKISKILCD